LSAFAQVATVRAADPAPIGAGRDGAGFGYPVRASMDHETPFLVALGTLVIAALVVGASGWILFVRDRAVLRAGSGGDLHHREADEDR
jgi:hypothetical protein